MDGQIAEAEEEYKQTCIDNGMTVIDEESGLAIDKRQQLTYHRHAEGQFRKDRK